MDATVCSRVFFFRDRIESNIKPSSSSLRQRWCVFFSLSLALSFSRGFVFVFQVASRPFSSRGETFFHHRLGSPRDWRERWCRFLSSGASSFAFGANERSEATRGGFEDRERFCFRCLRFAALCRARARFGRLEEGSRLVSMCISLFYFGCYFFFELNKPSRRYLYSRERVGIVLTQRRMHLFLLSVLFRAKPVESNARRGA